MLRNVTNHPPTLERGIPSPSNLGTLHDNSTLGHCILYTRCVQIAKDLLVFKRGITAKDGNWISLGFAPNIFILKCITVVVWCFCSLQPVIFTAKCIEGQSVSILITERGWGLGGEYFTTRRIRIQYCSLPKHTISCVYCYEIC